MCKVNKPGYMSFIAEGPSDESAEVLLYILDVHLSDLLERTLSWICTWRN